MYGTLRGALAGRKIAFDRDGYTATVAGRIVGVGKTIRIKSIHMHYELAVPADLRRRGFTIQQLHQLLRALHEQFGERLFGATGGGGSVQLLTDGREIYARTATGAFFNLLRAPAQALMVVGNEGLLKDLSGKVRTRAKRPKKISG